jgi:hypothetical protein
MKHAPALREEAVCLTTFSAAKQPAQDSGECFRPGYPQDGRICGFRKKEVECRAVLRYKEPTFFSEEEFMGKHKKHERAKELDRRRKRRKEALKVRAKEAAKTKKTK